MFRKFIRVLCTLLMSLFLVTPVLAEEPGDSTYTYTTEGGDWIPVELTETDGKPAWTKTDKKTDSYALDADQDGTFETDPESGMPLILLRMNGSEWTFSFVTESSGKYEYNVIETMNPDQSALYTVVDKDGNPVSFITVEGGSGIIVNKKDIRSGDLVIRKLVEGEASPSARFRFDIELSGKGYETYLKGTRTFGSVTFVDGKASVYLAGGESVSITGLPDGIGYTVTEIPVEGYNASWELQDKNGTQSGTTNSVRDQIQEADQDSVTFTNSLPPDEPQEEAGNLAVSKTVINGKEEDESEFSFRAIFMGLDPGTSYSFQSGENSSSFRADSTGMADVSFVLKDRQTAEFLNLPIGTIYQVTEQGSPDFTASFTITGTNLKTVETSRENDREGMDLSTSRETLDKDESATVAFTNRGPEPGPEEKLTEITITKQWEDSGNIYGARPDSLSIYLLRSTEEDEVKQGDIVQTVILSPEDMAGTSTWTYTFANLAAEDETGQPYYYYALENKDGLDEHYMDSTVVSEDGKQITITNRYVLLVSFPEAGQAGITLLTACGLGAIVYGVVWVLSKEKNKKGK